MKKNRFTETQIVGILKRHESGEKVTDLSRELGISEQTFYNWKAKYGGLEVNELKRLREMEKELSEYKLMYAESSKLNRAMKNFIEKNLGGLPVSERL
jgi:putative transposase